ncbi:DUF4160 domain-containing protein [Nitrincola schmidtii]|uniref:DUF4160 domain-containing protein n=1 Tax=Nitrincola schmidtii TaxID=1730894 RepID=UPI0023F31EC3|nr:DUF4160 domain-containing protein [Nitrincola schmidtii]
MFRKDGFRFFCFSWGEARMHVHVLSSEDEAMLWLEPEIALSRSFGYSDKHLNRIQQLVQEHEYEIVSAWQKHFKD